MKAILTSIALSASLISAAQTPTPHTPHPTPHTTAAPRPSLLNPASLHAKAPAVYKARFTTTAGDFVVEVHRDWAPLGADRFYNLVRSGYFTNAAFFRVVPGFVVQFGLSANPAVNKVWKDADIQDDPVKQSNKRGFLVFATAGPNTRTTQLFINFGDNSRLDGMGFAPFGTVVEGMDVVYKIFPGYGESPRQDLITDQGDTYIAANFPKIDKIKFARIVPPVPARRRTPPPPPSPTAQGHHRPLARHQPHHPNQTASDAADAVFCVTGGLPVCNCDQNAKLQVGTLPLAVQVPLVTSVPEGDRPFTLSRKVLKYSSPLCVLLSRSILPR